MRTDRARFATCRNVSGREGTQVAKSSSLILDRPSRGGSVYGSLDQWLSVCVWVVRRVMDRPFGAIERHTLLQTGQLLIRFWDLCINSLSAQT